MDSRGLAQVPDQFDAFEQFVREVTTTEGRLATTAIIVVVTLLVGFVAVPLLARATSRLSRQEILPGGIVDAVDLVNSYIPTTIAVLTARLLQTVVLVAASVALLVTWGEVDLAVTLVVILVGSLPSAGQVLLTFVILLVGYMGADTLSDTVRDLGDESDQLTEHQTEIMVRFGNIAILLVVVSGLLTLWGLDLSGLLVGAGVLGIVLGLAARQTLGSIFAGIVLMISQPFTVGDWVELGDNEGTVTHITVMYTEIREFDGKLVAIPNDIVSEQPIRNMSHQNILRLHTEVGIDYDSDPEYAEQVALEAVESVEEVIDGPPPETTTKSFGDSAIVLELLYWIETPNPRTARRATESVIYAVKHRFEEEGIGMPFPQRRLGDHPEPVPGMADGGTDDDGDGVG
jgi:small-conductance mechanosensitive channel